MARHKLENELIAIEVEEHGAELKSLVRKNTGKEYMWKADPKFWGRTSPVLFPFVGAVRKTVSHQGTDLHDGAAWICP